MTNTSIEPLAVTFTSDRRLVGDDARALRRPPRVSGPQSVHRLRRGVYTRAHEWASADDRTRHLTRMVAVAGTRRDDVVFVGISAAAVWGLPVIGAWPQAVEALAGPRSGVRSKNGVDWHHWSVPDDEIEAVGPWLVTSVARTLSDIARHSPFVSAVAALDHGLKATVTASDGSVHQGAEKEELLDGLRADENARGRARALAAISFADPLAESPGESLSRVQIHRLGFAPPLLQSRVERGDGGSDHPDFEWERAYGEFDGFAKYARPEYTQGRPAAEIVWNEKRREDRLRKHGKAVARWTWEDAWNPPRLRSILLAAGVEQTRRAAFSPDAFGEWVVNA
ncbi:hypothetical protein ACFVWR_03320 [Leifsonia sp. NPDC058292]|uniref:hypothetical protein n=1 Tax=Leifsonia sp. NPDC058292 TaxID=3346428 RepID=UPI0036D82EBD